MESRFSRQIVMPEIGEEGQKRLSRSTAIIIGMGALGTVESELLCRAGVGKLIIVDFDRVEESNLQRQSLYVADDIGRPKVMAAANHLKAIWPDIEVREVAGYLSLKNIHLLDEADIVLDGTDNMETRFLLNEYCKKHSIPIVFASAVLDRGSVIGVPNNDCACYNCVFSNRHAEEDCGSAGVLNATTHLSGTIAANEALKILLKHKNMQGFFSFSLFSNRFDIFGAKQRDDCPVCNGTYERLASQTPFAIRFCYRHGCYRADPLAQTADMKKVKELGQEQTDGTHILLIDNHKVIVDAYGGIMFPDLKDADIAKRIAKKLV